MPFLLPNPVRAIERKLIFLKQPPPLGWQCFFFSWKCVVCARAVTDAAGGQWHDGLICLDFLVSHIYIFVFESYYILVEALQKVAFMCFLFKCKNSNGPWPSYACCIMECDVFILYLNIYRRLMIFIWSLSDDVQYLYLYILFIFFGVWLTYLCLDKRVWNVCICLLYSIWSFVFVHYLHISCTFLVHVPKCI